MRYLLALLILALLLAGCTQYSSPPGVAVKELPKEQPPSGAGGAPEAPLKEFTIVASQSKFEPSTITVNKGDHVRLKVKSVDVTHGMDIEGYEINRTLEPGKEVVIDFIADKSGDFDFYCSVVCGAGHKGMTGKLIVK